MSTGGPHAAGCDGWHTADLSCAETVHILAGFRADPWVCPSGANGYHHFFQPAEGPLRLDVACEYGCGRTWGELDATLPH